MCKSISIKFQPAFLTKHKLLHNRFKVVKFKANIALLNYIIIKNVVMLLYHTIEKNQHKK